MTDWDSRITEGREPEFTLQWEQAEWRESLLDGVAAYHEGYECSVEKARETLATGLAFGQQMYWWQVRMTSAISEWPEVYDCGFAETMSLGMDRCRVALKKALAWT